MSHDPFSWFPRLINKVGGLENILNAESNDIDEVLHMISGLQVIIVTASESLKSFSEVTK